MSHLSFDGVEKEHVAGLEVVDSPPDGGGIAFDAARWKAARAVAFERLRSLLAASEAGPGWP